MIIINFQIQNFIKTSSTTLYIHVKNKHTHPINPTHPPCTLILKWAWYWHTVSGENNDMAVVTYHHRLWPGVGSAIVELGPCCQTWPALLNLGHAVEFGPCCQTQLGLSNLACAVKFGLCCQTWPMLLKSVGLAHTVEIGLPCLIWPTLAWPIVIVVGQWCCVCVWICICSHGSFSCHPILPWNPSVLTNHTHIPHRRGEAMGRSCIDGSNQEVL